MEPKNLIKYLFLIQAIIACFTCYARPDYNLPLFLFAYILWDIKEKLTDNYVHKFRLTLIFLISLIVDLVWIIYWGCFWEKMPLIMLGTQDYILLFLLCLLLILSSKSKHCFYCNILIVDHDLYDYGF